MLLPIKRYKYYDYDGMEKILTNISTFGHIKMADEHGLEKQDIILVNPSHIVSLREINLSIPFYSKYEKALCLIMSNNEVIISPDFTLMSKLSGGFGDSEVKFEEK